MKLPGSIPLYTRLGNEVANAQDPDLAPAKAEHVIAAFRTRFPCAWQRRPPSGQYNCHGLSFANRRTGIYDPTAVEKVLKDDGYRTIKREEVEPGDLVVYYVGDEVTHSGVVLEVVQGAPETPTLRELKIVSKWGQAGEYIHRTLEGPYAQHDLTYWTDRP